MKKRWIQFIVEGIIGIMFATVISKILDMPFSRENIPGGVQALIIIGGAFTAIMITRKVIITKKEKMNK